MVSFLQKNAAKIVIISGAALISTISGGGCDDAECTQDSTLSAKCSAGTDAQKKKCTDIANKAVSTIVLCKGKTCEDSEFASSGRCCIDAPATTTTTVAPPTCATDGLKEANKECSLAACPTATPYRVKIATGTSGCLAACATPSDTVRQTKECACVEQDASTSKPKAGGKQHFSAKDGICKSTGDVELPTCSFTDGKYNSNCTYDTDKTCNDYSNGTICTGTIIGANEYAVTDSLCIETKPAAADKNKKIVAAAKMKICTSGQVCQIASGTSAATCVPVTAATIKPCAASSSTANAVLNCNYAVGSSVTKNQYCGKRNGTEYAWVESTKECRANCSSTNGKAACACVNSVTTTAPAAVLACKADEPFCKTNICSATA